MPPLVIAAGIAGAAALGGAKIQSNAAGNARRDQQAGTDRALAEQRRVNQPYMDVGNQAIGRLGSMTSNAQPYTQQFGGPGGPNGFQAFSGPQMGQKDFSGQGQNIQQGQPLQSLGGLGRGPMGMARQMMQSGGMPPQGPPQPAAGGGMVRMRAPTGEVSDVPEQDVQRALTAGAQRLN